MAGIKFMVVPATTILDDEWLSTIKGLAQVYRPGLKQCVSVKDAAGAIEYWAHGIEKPFQRMVPEQVRAEGLGHFIESAERDDTQIRDKSGEPKQPEH